MNKMICELNKNDLSTWLCCCGLAFKLCNFLWDGDNLAMPHGAHTISPGYSCKGVMKLGVLHLRSEIFLQTEGMNEGFLFVLKMYLS